VTAGELHAALRTLVGAATPVDRQRLVAGLAIRLAERGHAKAVTVDVDGSDNEALAIARTFVTEVKTRGISSIASLEQALPAGTTLGASDVPQVDSGAPRPNYRFPSVPAAIVAEVSDALETWSVAGTTGRELADALHRRKKAVLGALNTLVADGKATREGRGRGTRFRLVQVAEPKEIKLSLNAHCQSLLRHEAEQWADVPFDTLLHDCM
jgi:hypothetical protein